MEKGPASPAAGLAGAGAGHMAAAAWNGDGAWMPEPDAKPDRQHRPGDCCGPDGGAVSFGRWLGPGYRGQRLLPVDQPVEPVFDVLAALSVVGDMGEEVGR